MAEIRYGNDQAEVLNGTAIPGTAAMLLGATPTSAQQVTSYRWRVTGTVLSTGPQNPVRVDLGPAVGATKLYVDMTLADGTVEAFNKTVTIPAATPADEATYAAPDGGGPAGPPAAGMLPPGKALLYPRPEGWEQWRTLTVTGTATVDGPEVIECGRQPTRVVFPTDRAVGPVRFNGVKGLVVIGGSLRALPGSSVGGLDQRLIQVQSGQGDIHFEGMDLDGAGADNSRETDAFFINGASATFTFQNVRVHDLHGKESTNHADGIQADRDVGAIRVHNFVVTSDYQGVKHQTVTGTSVGYVNISNADLIAIGRTDGDTTGGYMLWTNPSGVTPTTLKGVRIRPRGTFGYSAWPPSNWSGDPAKRAIVSADGNSLTWPASVNMSGTVVKRGPSDESDYVPAGSVGYRYTAAPEPSPEPDPEPEPPAPVDPPPDQPPAPAGFVLAAVAEATSRPPRVRLNVTGGADTDVLQVVRVGADGATTAVRQPVTLSGGAGLAYDYEAPYGEAVTYRTVSGEPQSAGPVTLAVNVGWLVHPFYLSLSLPLYGDRGDGDTPVNGPVLMESAAVTLTRSSSSATIDVLNRDDPIVQRVGRRRGTASTLAVRTHTRDQEEALAALVDDDAPLLLQVPAGAGWSLRTAWVLLGDVTQARREKAGATDQVRQWSAPYQVVRAPTGQSRALWTCGSVLDTYATCGDVLASYATCGDLEADIRVAA